MTSVGFRCLAMTCDRVNVLPEPVTPRRVCCFSPWPSPSTSLSIAWGWSPVGSKSATRLKSGTTEEYHQTPCLERAFYVPDGRPCPAFVASAHRLTYGCGNDHLTKGSYRRPDPRPTLGWSIELHSEVVRAHAPRFARSLQPGR